MDRRLFLKLTGMIAAASALEALPVSAAPLTETTPLERAVPPAPVATSSGVRVSVREPGLYQVSGRVRLDASLVEISGIAHTQTISWSGAAGTDRPVATFLSFEQIDRPERAPEIQVRGGQIESLTIVPVQFV
jgi:hypothetical protein